MIIQIAIAIMGVTAIWLTQSSSQHVRRYACLFGLGGQPFWFASAVTAEQWGIVVLCCFYTVAWARGVWSNWLSPKIVGPDGMTRGQRKLKLEHGTPAEFNQALYRACPEFISLDELKEASRKHRAKWDAA